MNKCSWLRFATPWACLAFKKIIHSFVNLSRTNKSSKSGIPGLYFTNNGVLSHFKTFFKKRSLQTDKTKQSFISIGFLKQNKQSFECYSKNTRLVKQRMTSIAITSSIVAVKTSKYENHLTSEALGVHNFKRYYLLRNKKVLALKNCIY